MGCSFILGFFFLKVMEIAFDLANQISHVTVKELQFVHHIQDQEFLVGDSLFGFLVDGHFQPRGGNFLDPIDVFLPVFMDIKALDILELLLGKIGWSTKLYIDPAFLLVTGGKDVGQ